MRGATARRVPWPRPTRSSRSQMVRRSSFPSSRHVAGGVDQVGALHQQATVDLAELELGLRRLGHLEDAQVLLFQSKTTARAPTPWKRPSSSSSRRPTRGRGTVRMCCGTARTRIRLDAERFELLGVVRIRHVGEDAGVDMRIERLDPAIKAFREARDLRDFRQRTDRYDGPWCPYTIRKALKSSPRRSFRPEQKWSPPVPPRPSSRRPYPNVR